MGNSVVPNFVQLYSLMEQKHEEKVTENFPSHQEKFLLSQTKFFVSQRHFTFYLELAEQLYIPLSQVGCDGCAAGEGMSSRVCVIPAIFDHRSTH